MHSYRITKYNPIYRAESGGYTKDDWTAISDIGRTYDDVVFNYEKYLEIEKLYINAVHTFMSHFSVENLIVQGLEQFEEKLITTEFISKDMCLLNKNVHEGYVLNRDEIAIACQLILREEIWFRMIHQTGLQVHFGYDYYMYIVTNQSAQELTSKINSSGLFMEDFESPYMIDNNE